MATRAPRKKCRDLGLQGRRREQHERNAGTQTYKDDDKITTTETQGPKLGTYKDDGENTTRETQGPKLGTYKDDDDDDENTMRETQGPRLGTYMGRRQRP